MKNGDKPINPVRSQIYTETGIVDYQEHGLTKREYFAAMAMQALIKAMPDYSDQGNAWNAKHSVLIADSLLAELDKSL